MSRSMEIRIGEIPVAVQKKRIKNMYLRVSRTDGSVRLSAPVGMPEEMILAFVRSKESWIRKQLAYLPKTQERQYWDGEKLCLWGQPYALRVEYAQRGLGVTVCDGEAVLRVRGKDDVTQREAVVNEWYRAELKQRIGEVLPAWEARTGLACSGWQVKNMRTRWGTCNTRTGKIWLNLQLAKKAPECLEYVILHELAHLKYPNHGKDFQAFLDRHMPNWRDIRKRCNEPSI